MPETEAVESMIAPYILTLVIMIATSPKRTLIGAPAELSIPAAQPDLTEICRHMAGH